MTDFRKVKMKEGKGNSNIEEPQSEFMISPEIEQQFISKWESAGISNDFIFCKVMQAKEFLRSHDLSL